jgi:hypothetical protein
LEGDSRPTMKGVEMALENLWARKKPSPYNSASKRYDGDQIVAPYKSIEDLLANKEMPIDGAIEESSRQYTMEEEIFLSARYPRWSLLELNKGEGSVYVMTGSMCFCHYCSWSYGSENSVCMRSTGACFCVCQLYLCFLCLGLSMQISFPSLF